MNAKLFVLVVTLFVSCLSSAELVSISPEAKPFSNVRVSMQRMLRSTEGRYFLNLYAGIWNPHATLYDLEENKTINLKGLQKGDQLTLKSVKSDIDEIMDGAYQLNGLLNANSGNLKADLTIQNNAISQVQFEPAFKVKNKPTFVFKFYGVNDSTQPYVKTLKRVDVVDKNNNKVVQSLTGFTAFANSIGYMDVNFDGYYDVVLADLSDGKTLEDKRYIYWMYNPKTQQFQRSSQLEKIIGFPQLHGEKQQIDFGNARLYQVKNGLLNRIATAN